MKKEETDMIYGLRPVLEAVHAGKEIEKVLVQNGLTGTTATELKKALVDNKIAFQFVPVEKLNRLVRGNHQGAVCFISPVEYSSIEQVIPGLFEQGRNPLILILDRITDVRNLGAIARTAECAGVDAIVIPTHGSARMSSDAVKASAGALHRVTICREKNLKLVIEFLKDSGLQVLACTEKATLPYYHANLAGPLAVIMGSEDDGVSDEYMRKADASIAIPMKGQIGSLNVSVACGILMFEAVKQRIIQDN